MCKKCGIKLQPAGIESNDFILEYCPICNIDYFTVKPKSKLWFELVKLSKQENKSIEQILYEMFGDLNIGE